MQSRIDYRKVSPGGVSALATLEGYVRGCGLDAGLLELVRLRASQLNGCAYCIDMHTKDARAGGETEQRLYLVSAWHESPFYSERERAALAWTEALTRLEAGGVRDEVYRQARQQFTEKELVDLSFALVAINGWNRLAIPFHAQPGTYHIRP